MDSPSRPDVCKLNPEFTEIPVQLVIKSFVSNVIEDTSPDDPPPEHEQEPDVESKCSQTIKSKTPFDYLREAAKMDEIFTLDDEAYIKAMKIACEQYLTELEKVKEFWDDETGCWDAEDINSVARQQIIKLDLANNARNIRFRSGGNKCLRFDSNRNIDKKVNSRCGTVCEIDYDVDKKICSYEGRLRQQKSGDKCLFYRTDLCSTEQNTRDHLTETQLEFKVGEMNYGRTKKEYDTITSGIFSRSSKGIGGTYGAM